MPYVSLKMRPGIDVESTPLLNEAGFSESAGIRFFQGLPEKIGGWAHLNSVLLTGTATGMHAWSDLSGNAYIAIGTEQWLELFYGGTLYNITPVRTTTNPMVDFSTTMGSAQVTVKDAGNGVVAGDWVNFIVPVSVGGLIIQDDYQVFAVLDADDYIITAASLATASISHGGAVPVFDSTMSSTDLRVTLGSHNLVVGNSFMVQVSTAVGGFTLSGLYTVTSVLTASEFVIQPGGSASSTATVSENGGNARIEYAIHTGLASAAYSSLGGGYGIGPYGGGPYGVSPSGTVLMALRQWFLDNFGQDLLGNYTGSPIYIWAPPAGSGPALELNSSNFPGAQDPPLQVNVSFVAAPQQMVIALGVNEVGGSTFDPLLVRWCDIGDFTNWSPSSTNAAGSYRIPSGSRLIGGISSPNFTVLWTDIDMWLMTFLGGSGTLVWGFTKIASGVDLLAARTCAVYRNLVFWISSNGFFSFDGNAIRQIQCPVWDKFWYNLNRTQVDKVNAQVNSWFQEISWAFPSLAGSGNVDSRITYNIRENSWTYDDVPTQTARTSWIDDNVYGSPIGTDLTGYLQQQDSDGVYDADGAALPSSIRTGWFSVAEGSIVTMLERLAADFIVTGGSETVQVTVYSQNYPNGPVTTYGPFPYNPTAGPPYSIVRARGRFMSLAFSSTGMGIFWRAGNVRYFAKPVGRRP